MAGALQAVDITWEGINFNTGSASTDISDTANWSSGTVPGASDKAIFRYYSDTQGSVEGNLFVTSADTTFNPSAIEYNGNFDLWYQISSFLAIDKSLDLTNGLVVTGQGSGGGGSVREDRLRIGTNATGVVINTSTFDITSTAGQGSPSWGFFTLGSGDQTANSGTVINITGSNINFGTPTNDGDGSIIGGGGNVDNPTNTYNPQMRFTGVGATIHFAQAGNRTAGVIGLGHTNLDMRSDQIFTADPLAFVSMLGSSGSTDGGGHAGQFVVESIDGGRLDNLGDLNIKIYGAQGSSASDTTAMRMQGGTYGSLMMSSSGSSGRVQRINQTDDVAYEAEIVDFNGGVPEQSGYGLALQNGASNADTQIYDLKEFNLDVASGVRMLDSSSTGSDRPLLIVADNSTVTIGGDLFMDAPNLRPENAFSGGTVANQIGIDGGTTGVDLTIGGSFDTRVVSYSSRDNLVFSTTTFTSDSGTIEVGDASTETGLNSGTYAFGSLNIGSDSDPANITLLNDWLNNNPAVTGDGNVDKVGEKLIAGNLVIKPNSTFDINGLDVEVVTSLDIDATSTLDLNTGTVLSDGGIVEIFLGIGDQVSDWNVFADQVIDSSNPLFEFTAILDGGNTKWQGALVPEPSTYAMLLTAIVGFAAILRRRRQQEG